MKKRIATLTIITIFLTAVSHATLTDDIALHLSDSTWVGGLKWEELKEDAMEHDFEQNKLFVSDLTLFDSTFDLTCMFRGFFTSKTNT